MSQVRQHQGLTMVKEELALEDADDLCEENADLKKRFQNFSDSKAFRLSFFSAAFHSERELTDIGNSDFIGYAIIKCDDLPSGFNGTRVYESVLPTSRHDNNYIKGEQEWACYIAGNPMTVKGYLYAQQNGATNVCAHVALRTVAARFHKDGDMTYGEMNRLLNIDVTRINGLNQEQMVQILEAAGAHCIKIEYNANDPKTNQLPPFQKYLYGSIESGFPAIICFGTSSHNYHAIPVFGHTFNEDTWVPNAAIAYFQVGASTRYIPSESWLSTFIGHDDNCGSNFCIPRDYLYTNKYCDSMSTPGPCVKREERVSCVLATIPKTVKVNPVRAELIGVKYLFEMLKQLPALSGAWQHRLTQNRLVLRPILVTGPDYADHLSGISDWDNHSIHPAWANIIRKIMPNDYLWLIELSVPELFAVNKRKVAEVLVRADAQGFVLARLPGYFVLQAKQTPDAPTFVFVPSGIQNHVPLYGC